MNALNKLIASNEEREAAPEQQELVRTAGV